MTTYSIACFCLSRSIIYLYLLLAACGLIEKLQWPWPRRRALRQAPGLDDVCPCALRHISAPAISFCSASQCKTGLVRPLNT